MISKARYQRQKLKHVKPKPISMGTAAPALVQYRRLAPTFGDQHVRRNCLNKCVHTCAKYIVATADFRILVAHIKCMQKNEFAGELKLERRPHGPPSPGAHRVSPSVSTFVGDGRPKYRVSQRQQELVLSRQRARF